MCERQQKALIIDCIDPVTKTRQLHFFTDDGHGNGNLIFTLEIESGKPDHWDAQSVAFTQLAGQLTAGGGKVFLAPHYRGI